MIGIMASFLFLLILVSPANAGELLNMMGQRSLNALYQNNTTCVRYVEFTYTTPLFGHGGYTIYRRDVLPIIETSLYKQGWTDFDATIGYTAMPDSFAVPPGWYYQVNDEADFFQGPGGLYSWSERDDCSSGAGAAIFSGNLIYVRSLGQVYQNDSDKRRTVSVVLQGFSNRVAGAYAYADSTNPPARVLDRVYFAAPAVNDSHLISIRMDVAPGEFYKVIRYNGDESLNDWYEVDQ